MKTGHRNKRRIQRRKEDGNGAGNFISEGSSKENKTECMDNAGRAGDANRPVWMLCNAGTAGRLL